MLAASRSGRLFRNQNANTMTLVVARLTPKGVRLAGDMRVTDRDEAGPKGYMGAALKMILLRPSLCIAYAGNVGLALRAIRHVRSNDLPVNDAEAHLLDTHLRANGDVDFLIASLRPSRLSVVKDGSLGPAVTAAYVGSPDAYAEYNRHYAQEIFRPPLTSTTLRLGLTTLRLRPGWGTE